VLLLTELYSVFFSEHKGISREPSTNGHNDEVCIIAICMHVVDDDITDQLIFTDLQSDYRLCR